MLRAVLRDIRSARDASRLFTELGYAHDDQPFGHEAIVIARWQGFKVIAVDADEPREGARALARALATNSARALAVAVTAPHTIAVTAPRLGTPGISRVFVIPLDNPSAAVLEHLARFRPKPSSNGLSHALRVEELLATEIAGERFYAAFRFTLERMAGSLRRKGTAPDRRMAALLPLIRVLFLYFVQAKGWLNHRPDYLRVLLDDSLAARRHFHRTSLNPLFFGTLNRPPTSRRGVSHLGRVPYLNGGLFQPYPAEERIGALFSNELWRHAFDDLFEKFRFCVREGAEVDAVAPDMLGRVFERVMEAEARHETGTFYTPETVVRQLVGAALETALLGDSHLTPDQVRCVVQCRPLDHEVVPYVRRKLRRLRVLDPAAGSGAFLLGALETLCAMHLALRDRQGSVSRLHTRRRILRENLFGVDLNPVAVRLAELRLWLAVIADDPTTDIGAVEPLPNLDGLVQQGDSLLDPIAAASALGIRSGLPRHAARAVSDARAALFSARGDEQRRAKRRLQHAERDLADALLERALAKTEHAVRDLVAAARGRDLFGRRTGLNPQQRKTHQALREQQVVLKRAVGAVRDGVTPFFSFEVHAPEVMRSGGFSVVVGNPPWVRAERVSREMRGALKHRFSWWCTKTERGFSHLPDISIAFLQRALELAAPGGAVALLLPSKMTSAAYAQSARAHLVRETTLRYLHRVSDRQAARFGATTYPLAIVVRNQHPSPAHKVQLGFQGRSSVKQQVLAQPGPWILVPDRVRDALVTFRQSGPSLGDVAPPFLGVKTGADAILVGKLIDDCGVTSRIRFGNNVVEIETGLLRSVLRGRDIVPFKSRPVRVVLWGYDAEGAPLAALPPKAAAHVAQHRRRLLARADHRNGPPWTLFRLAAASPGHRVIWPDIARRPRAVVLDATRSPTAFPLNSCYVSRASDLNTALVIAAVMNSSFAQALVVATADEARGGYRRVNARVASAIPVPESGQASEPLIALSRTYHDRDGFHQGDLDEAVGHALGLPARACQCLRRFAADNG